MDAYGNYFSNWYDKFFKEQTELMKRLSKSLTIDSTKVGGLSPDQAKQLTANMETIGKILEQNQAAIDQLKSYTQINLPPSFPGSITKQALKSMNSSALTVLNPDIQKLNRELMNMNSSHPAIKSIVERAAELSTMQRQADAETEPEDDEVPNAVEEYIENNPEEARTIAEEVQHIFLETAGFSKKWWDGLPTDYKRNTFLALVAALHNCFSSATAQSGGVATGADMAMSLFLFVLTAGVLYPSSED